MATNSNESSSPVEEKVVSSQLEAVRTNERVPGHSAYYEKDGLRTYGDGEDHDHEPQVQRPLYHSTGIAADSWKRCLSGERCLSLLWHFSGQAPKFPSTSLVQTISSRVVSSGDINTALRRHSTSDIPVLQPR